MSWSRATSTNWELTENVSFAIWSTSLEKLSVLDKITSDCNGYNALEWFWNDSCEHKQFPQSVIEHNI